MSNGKAMAVLLIVGLIKKTLHKMSQYFPKLCKSFGGNVEVELDLFSYATKVDLKNGVGVDTSKLATKSDLASLKAKIDVNKLNTDPVASSKLSDAVTNVLVKKSVYDKLVVKSK